MAALQLRPKLRTLHNPSLVNLFSTFPTPSDPTPADQSPSSTSPHPAQSQSQSQSQSALSSCDSRETLLASLRPLLEERERKGAEGETMATKTGFLKTCTQKELWKKLMELPPEGRFRAKLSETEDEETESNIGGVHMRDMRESLTTLKMSNDENAMKSSTMGKGEEKNVANKQFRWSKPKHTLLLEILADEAAKGNKLSNTFKPASFALVAKSISKKFKVECVPDHVESHLRTIMSMWNIIGTLREKSGFGWDENLRMITCDKKVYDKEVKAHPKHEQYLNKKIEMYDEMAIVVGKDIVTESFAKSFNNIEQHDNVLDSEHVDLDFDDASSKGKYVAFSNSGSTKRSYWKRSRGDIEDSYLAISKQLGEIAAALKAFNKGVDADHLYQEVMKVKGYDEFMLASAFDHLVVDEKVGRGFLAKNAKLRKFWLDNFFKNHEN